MDDNKIDNDNQLFLNLVEKAKELFESDRKSNQFYSNVKFQREWKDFKDADNDCKDCFINASDSLSLDEAVRSVISENIIKGNTPKRGKKWCWLVICLIVLILLIVGAFYVLLFGRHPQKEAVPITVDSYSCFNADCRDTNLNVIRYDSVGRTLGLCQGNNKVTLCESDRCDNMEVTVGPQGAITYSYRKYDKWIIVLVMLLSIGVCTALVFFIISMRKTIAADQEYEKSELNHHQKLIEKYMDALIDEHRLKVQRCEKILDISQQKQLLQMETYQKEQENWWKYVFKESEIRKEFLDSLLETVRKKYDLTSDRSHT
jgi:flagellar basal body-associated protein FliL